MKDSFCHMIALMLNHFLPDSARLKIIQRLFFPMMILSKMSESVTKLVICNDIDAFVFVCVCVGGRGSGLVTMNYLLKSATSLHQGVFKSHGQGIKGVDIINLVKHKQ
jgi:hypothetical protein